MRQSDPVSGCLQQGVFLHSDVLEETDRMWEGTMKTSLHHVHLFASDLDKALLFYSEMFGAEVLFDAEMAGTRNVMIAIGGGRINFYDQPPRGRKRGAVHHLGIETDDLKALVEHMKGRGFIFRKPIRDLGAWKYIMVEGPDSVLLELFQVVREQTPEELYPRLSAL